MLSSPALQPAAVKLAVSEATHILHAVLPSFFSGAQSALSFARHFASIAANTKALRKALSAVRDSHLRGIGMTHAVLDSAVAVRNKR